MQSLFEPDTPRKKLAGHLVWFGIWAAVTGVGLTLEADPTGFGTHTQLGLNGCTFLHLTGRPCPACGMTTCVTNVVHGNFIEAFRAHAVGVFTYFAWTASAWTCLYGFATRRRFRSDDPRIVRATFALAGLILAFSIWRAYGAPGIPWVAAPYFDP